MKFIVKLGGRAVEFKQLNGARVRWQFAKQSDKATQFDHVSDAYKAIEDYGLDAERCEVVKI